MLEAPGRARHSVPVQHDYSTATPPPELRDRPILRKPVTLANLKRAVAVARTGIRSVN
jgi:hypothetical protein